jgi:hypothetical protein
MEKYILLKTLRKKSESEVLLVQDSFQNKYILKLMNLQNKDDEK